MLRRTSGIFATLHDLTQSWSTPLIRPRHDRIYPQLRSPKRTWRLGAVCRRGEPSEPCHFKGKWVREKTSDPRFRFPCRILELKSALPRRPADEAQLPFLMEMERPRKVRIELQFKGQTAVQVYDGTNGWKVRPFLNRAEVEPYTADELNIASHQEDLDGPLVDYAAKGSNVELDGNEKVEGRDTYKLKVTENSGHVFHIWIDAETFLEAKVEGQPRRLDGNDHPVEIYYRDYRAMDGLTIPFVMETRVLAVARNALGLKDTPVPPEKIVLDKVVVNPKLDDELFSRPAVAVASKGK